MAHILVVDDDLSMLSFIKTALERADHQVTGCNNGKDALEALKQSQDIDLLLTDIVMPGMDGIELSKEAKVLLPDLKTMFISGFSVNTADTNTKISFKGNLMAKPFHLKDLIAQVEKLLAE
jgi:two-component system cell cycle response regulator CpdR